MSGNLELGDAGGCDATITNCTELDESWTPKFANIISYWKFENNLNDSIGPNEGTAQNTPVFSSNSKLGNYSVDFEYSNGDYVSTGNVNSIHAISVMAWVNLESIPNAAGNPNFLDKWAWIINKRSWLLGSVGGKLATMVSRDGSYADRIEVIESIAPEINKWTHVAFTYDGQTLKFFKNGNLIGSSSFGTPSAIYSNTATDVWLGRARGIEAYRYVDGLIDEAVIFDANLSATEVAEIYARQSAKYSGTYTSPVINLGTLNTWTNIDWTTSLPFGKELPGTSGNEGTIDYASLVNSTGISGNSELGNGLIALWRANETVFNQAPGGLDLEDSSSNSHHAQATAGVSLNEQGKLSKSVFLNGSNTYLQIADHNDFSFGNGIVDSPFSIAGWTKRTGESSGSYSGIFSKDAGGAIREWALIMENSSQEIRFFIKDQGGGSQQSVDSTTLLKKNEWVHLAVSYDGRGGVNAYQGIKIYINGQSEVLKDQMGNPYTAMSNTTAALEIGRYSSSNTQILPGYYDEWAIWSRVLHENEVLELYRRGANRANAQVRSCNDSACDTEVWIGPDGTSETYFSELHNCTSIDVLTGLCSGNVNTGSPALGFSDFVRAPTDNQYFQYRITLESDDEAGACDGATHCMPSVSRIEVGPIGRYFGGSPSIMNKTPVSYSLLSKLKESKSGGCTPMYQLSRDGTNFFYWNGVKWSAASNDVQSNDASTVTSKMSLFGKGDLYWKSYLTSDSTQSCLLDELEFIYKN